MQSLWHRAVVDCRMRDADGAEWRGRSFLQTLAGPRESAAAFPNTKVPFYFLHFYLFILLFKGAKLLGL